MSRALRIIFVECEYSMCVRIVFFQYKYLIKLKIGFIAKDLYFVIIITTKKYTI